MQQIKTYDSGLRVVVEEMKGFTSVSFNIYVGIGSIKEDETNKGISHLIEHMLFKGTQKRSAYDIADELKNIGAQSNAFTSREATVFYTRSVSDYVEPCVEILSDMFLNSKFDPKELRKEKNVVIEEIKMYQDDPDSVCSTLVDENFYKGSPYSSNIIGTKKSVLAITREQIIDYMSKNYVPENIVISFAGNIDFEKAISLVEKYFQPLLQGNAIAENNHFIKNVYPEKSIAKVKYKDNAQSEVCITYPSVDRFSEFIYAAQLLNIVWGSSSNMSSRLFQTIREKMGLVYRISSSLCTCDYGGDMSIQFSTSTKNVPIALKAIRQEIDKLIKEGITEKELSSAKINIYTSSQLRLENTSHISLTNARKLIVFGEIQSMEEYIEKINNVTLEDIKKLIDYIYNNEHFVIACVGRDKNIKLLKEFSK